MFDSMKIRKVAKRIILKNRKWIYRGEGNANLVLALVKERKIIRLRKSTPSEKPETEEKRIWRELDFCRGIMLPLLGERFVPVPTVVRLYPQELSEVNRTLMAIRPLHRHGKGLYTNYAAIFNDLCLLPIPKQHWAPTYCVEVKPKQGWIPFSDRRLSKCTFCLYQYSKLKQGMIKERSQYCPLDLFSGNRNRMKRAIIALLKCPQNNLKMFKNGTMVYGDSTFDHYEIILKEWFGCYDTDTLLDNFTNIVIDALVSDLSETGEQISLIRSDTPNRHTAPGRIPKYLLDEAQSLIQEPTCYREFESLPRNCVLSRILQVQKLDTLGSDAVYDLYSNILYKEDYGYVNDLLKSFHNIYKPINAYLLATTAKDCSILIAFQKVPVNVIDYDYFLKDLNGVHYAFNVGVSDLDPKPMSCIEKHKKRDYDAVVNCIEALRSNSL
ncbi:UNVERIFIED_CONTAM: hypothetical protein PYX00_009009 [Menopon gallinae]|uniref:Inositol-pentakisphosphate 2-kinase n=1 Tax=Menopon gallinae TaxID=328185 RepID=A0AAW2H9H7_9NEOP